MQPPTLLAHSDAAAAAAAAALIRDSAALVDSVGLSMSFLRDNQRFGMH